MARINWLALRQRLGSLPESTPTHHPKSGSSQYWFADELRLQPLAGSGQRLHIFADLRGSGCGRPSVPAEQAAVMVLQSLEGLSDRGAVQALRTDLQDVIETRVDG